MLQILTSPISGILGDHPMHRYSFPNLWINGRNVSLEKILHEKETSRTTFEESTFKFIKDWLSGQEDFELTTSGSTGEPKSITVSRAQMMTSALKTSERISLEKVTTVLICLDTKYVAGKMMLARCLTLGLGMMAVDPTANPLIKIPVDKCVQFTAFVPYQVAAILESKHPHLLNNVDKVLIGGAPLNNTTIEELDRFQCECYETYGMTETVSHIALRRVNGGMKQQYFETLPGIRISQDERGCLVIAADYLPAPVTTNDLVEIAGDGKFLWLGRWDRVINTGGVKVLPEKIEREIQKIFHQKSITNRFFIAALPDERLGSKVVLILEGVQMSSERVNPLLGDLKSALSAFELPKEVYHIPKFRETNTQKVDRIQTLAAATLLSSVK